MFARLEAVRPDNRTVTVIPANAIAYSLHGDTLFVVKDVPAKSGEGQETRVERRVVTVGERRGDLVSVTKGVEPGESIVTTGQLKLQDGTKITLADDVLDKSDAADAPDQTAEAK
jgi:membrane fusion protein (multidrug efflux system)